MNVQQSSKSRFTVQENLSTQHGVCTSSLSHNVSQHKASRGTYSHLDSLFIIIHYYYSILVNGHINNITAITSTVASWVKNQPTLCISMCF